MISLPHAFIATILVIPLYFIASVSARDRWNSRLVLNPLKLIADDCGRSSLSNLQVFSFTLIVVWLAVYWLVREGELVAINLTVLGLLGIAVGGSGLGKTVDAARFRVSGDNWAWAKSRQWIARDFTKTSSTREPRFSDLVNSDQGFEVARFQAVVFSLVVGGSLLYNGATAANAEAFSSFTIGNAYLTLLGISQAVYVGGKAIGGNLVADLDSKLTEVRSLEQKFQIAVASSNAWQDADPSTRDLRLAAEIVAPDEFLAYVASADVAASMIEQLTGNKPAKDFIQPTLPSP